MSSYIERILQPGEQVRHLATIHWITYVPGFVILLVSLLVLWLARSVQQGQGFWLAVSAVLAAVAAYAIFRAWFDRWITEIAVTDRRVVFKTGFIRRDTKEMQMDKIESVEVLQSIAGRLFGYGDIVVRGTGHGEFKRIKTIARPLNMRNQITGR